MARAPRHERIIAYALLTVLRSIRMRWATAVYVFLLRRWDARLNGRPAYISGKTYIDGTDYSLVTLGEGVTVSRYVRILTNHWAPHTIGKPMGGTRTSHWVVVSRWRAVITASSVPARS